MLTPPKRRYDDAVSLPTPGGVHTPQAIAEMQLAILEALRSGEPLPDEMRLHLTLAFEYLCAGVAFDLITPVKRPGGRQPPIARHLQAAAIRYLRWVEDGRIDDQAPVSTIAAAYGVSTRAVGYWKSQWKGQGTPPVYQPWVDAWNKDRESAWTAGRRREHPVKAFMQASGKHYERLTKSKPE